MARYSIVLYGLYREHMPSQEELNQWIQYYYTISGRLY